MIHMLKQLWAALAVFFGATQRAANALDNVLAVAEEASENLLIESRIERKAKLTKLRTKLGISEEELKEMSKVERLLEKEDD